MLKDIGIIRKKLKENGYTNKLIDYKEFLELYEPYRKEMEEKEFAEIIGIAYSNYQKIKNRKARAMILKEEKKISEQKKEEIRENLRKNGYTNKLINYQEFLELYESYRKEMEEKEFAEIIGILDYNYKAMKNRKTKTTMLKGPKEVSGEKNISKETRKEIEKEIIENVREKGYANKLISYQEFLELYELYKMQMKEKEFAEILGISYNNYCIIKYKKTRTRVLKKSKKVSEEMREKVIENVREKGYANKLISYSDFLELYEPYRMEMKEKEFAEIIGILNYNYKVIKNRKTKTRILKGKNKIAEERKEEIRENLRKNGHTNKLINYQEFLELYEPYRKEIEEKEFAEILGISYSNYKNIKNKGTRAIILKKEKIVSEERKKEIRENLEKKGYTNKSINYQEFLELYEPYRKEIDEKEFAEILGISYDNHSIMKKKGQKARILKVEKKILLERKEEIREKLKQKGNIGSTIDYQEFL